ncbi:hypothetical protein GPECTOR_46g206 [Gonium pectorale]|uniref:Uncharacterized protein n=1 Tax=Gonium pectorale TaxID=33097 RepID=A0A150G8G3_GONPE|nr:hypothetical protein GPECTOR_46g206 [Gonium pectorale]|eukprot:KXZ46137.1 hypothetical protein GPECTOR_46g206 [Gonium pectorale]
MPSLNLLVIGEEKALPDFEDALESCKRYIGPIKLFTAHKAVDGVSRLQKLVQTCGQCHAAFLSHHFTLPGKEEFSDTLRKVIKEKYPDVPVICWGNPKKGGELNKHFHATLDFSKGGGDINAVVDILKQVQAGQIRAEYLHKDQRKGLDRRNSLDRSDSIRGGVAPRSDSLLRRTDSQRRASTEGLRAPTLDRTASTRRSMEDDTPLAGAMQTQPTLRRKSIDAGATSPTGGAAGLSHTGSLNAAGAGAMGMGGMGMGLPHTASMAHGGGSMAMGMGGMGMPIGGVGGMGLGMPGLTTSPGGSMNVGMGMGGMGMGMGVGAMGGAAGMGMGVAPAAGGMPGLAAGGSMNGLIGMGAAAGVGDISGMMGSMALGAATAAPAMPAAAAASPAAAAGGGSNAELIKMLAAEVARLRKAVEEKRAREAEAATHQQQLQQLQQLQALQQQQALLQQQLAAMGVANGSGSGGVGMGVGGGMGMMNGGMPMGI